MPRVHAGTAVRAILLLLTVSLVGACSAAGAAPASGGGEIPGWPLGQAATGPLPVIASSQLIVGQNRFIYTLVDSSNAPLAAPSLTTKVTFYDLDRDPQHPATSADGRFLWAIPNERGFYVATVSFPAAGNWGVEVATSGKSATGATTSGTTRLRFNVLEKGSSIPVGSKAPASDTPTLASAGGDVHRISTDPSPDPAFYRVSVAQAIAQHKPFLLIFATPAFCQSRVCGPTLDEVKTIAAGYPGFTFINVEPYKLEFTGGRLQPVLDAQGNLQPVKATDDWGLQQEPWMFVVDRDGIVRASFEAIASPDELTAAIDAVN